MFKPDESRTARYGQIADCLSQENKPERLATHFLAADPTPNRPEQEPTPIKEGSHREKQDFYNDEVSDGGGNQAPESAKQCRPPPFAPPKS